MTVLLFPWAQLLTISAELGKSDPTQCCLNCEVKLLKSQEMPDLWLSAHLADACCIGFYVPAFSCVLLYCIPKSEPK